MKNISKRLIRDEKGVAMILALILLLIGGLICAALLGHMGAGLLAGEVYGGRTLELYAADAGVEDAIWKLPDLNLCPNQSTNYIIPDINGKSIEVSIYYVGEGIYKITSIAATDSGDGGGTAAIDSSTIVEAYVSTVSTVSMNFSALLDNAIVSQGTITIKPNDEVYGVIWLPDKEDLSEPPHWTHVGEVKDEDNLSITWPTVDQLSSYYLEDVENAPDPGPSIDIKDLNPKAIGPCFREGNLAIDNTGSSDTLVLEGTVYVRGNLDFKQPGGHKYNIYLNGHTIFAEGSITFPSAGQGKDPKVSISGSGCIIAVGDIYFKPGIEGDDFVLVMSITDKVHFQPGGDFTGCIAGNDNVELWSHCTLNWIPPEDKVLDFPGMEDGDESSSIVETNIISWELSQQ